MTGSTQTGRAIAATCAPRFARLQLELGSNNPAVVLADADLAVAAKVIVDGWLKLSGQWCEAPRRVFAPHKLLGELVEAITAQAATWRIGSSLEESTQLGPVAFSKRRDRLQEQLAEQVAAGATVITAASADSPQPDRGFFFPPTIAVGGSTQAHGELFGPLLTVHGYDTVEDALQAANQGPAGLAGYVLTADRETGYRVGSRLEAGEIKINGSSVLDMAADSQQSFFADSGIGGHGDAALLAFFTGNQIVGTDRPDLPI